MASHPKKTVAENSIQYKSSFFFDTTTSFNFHSPCRDKIFHLTIRVNGEITNQRNEIGIENCCTYTHTYTHTHTCTYTRTHIYRDTQAFASLREIFIVASFEDIFLDDISLYIYAKDTYKHSHTHVYKHAWINTYMDRYTRA